MGFDPQHFRPGATSRTVRPRRIGGTGKGLEALVLSNQQGVTLVQHGTASKRIGKDVVIQTKGPVDFSGVFADGHAIYFDAKETHGRASFDCSVSHVPEHQRLQLLRVGQGGATSGLLVLATATRTLHWLDWRSLVVRKTSYPWDELKLIGSAQRAIDWRKVRD